MQTIDIHPAKNQLLQLVKQAEAGEEIIIVRDGQPIAKLVPFSTSATGQKRVLGVLAGLLHVADDFNAALPDDMLKAFEGR